MVTTLLGLRREDARPVWLAFATLLVIIAAHAMLETARDALFLADVPVRRLPWAYLGIASLAFAAGHASTWLGARRPPRRVLAATLLAGAAGTMALFRVVATPSPAWLMALYIWTGVLVSVVVPQFWVLLAGQTDVAQAKRAYAFVAAGGILGATIGSMLAVLTLRFEGPRALLPFAACLLVAAACLPGLGPPAAAGAASAAPPPPAEEAEEATRMAAVWGNAYFRRIVLLAVTAPVVGMGVDFVFKSIVAREVPRASLGPFFAHFNAVVNGLALLFQVTIAPRLLQNLRVVRNLCVLPASLGGVAVAVAATGGLPATLVLRGTDGVLRHSLHRAATEILFLPVSPPMRVRLRALAESLGQRGGQLAGSFLLLAALALGATPQIFAAAVAMLCGAWLLGYLRLQAEYVDRFRAQLRALNASSDGTVPDLDLQALETLVATLGADNDADVIAALDLLASYGRLHLVSPLILYHPAPKVVLHALELFERSERDDVQAIRRRLLEHGDPLVRAAALRHFTARARDRAVVRTMLSSDPSPLVRRTALVLWLGFGDDTAGALDEAVGAVVAFPDTESRVAMASALAELPEPLLLPVARALLVDPRAAVRRQVARSLATDPDTPRLSLLTELVALPECRAVAREGLLALGEPALEHAARVLEDTGTSTTLRRHLPRTISRFGSARAAEILVTQLAREEDDRVVYKILRGLGRLRADEPALPVDRDALVAVAERALERTLELLAFRVATDLLCRTGAGAPDLLPALLEELEQRSLERVFRVLQILETGEDFAAMFAALSVDSPAARAGARELLEHVLEGRSRDVLLALTDSLPPADRLRAAAAAVSVTAAEQTLAACRLPVDDPAALPRALAGVLLAMRGDRNVLLAGIAGRQLSGQRAGPHLVEVPRVAS